MNKCLGCHCDVDDKYHFCSYTCVAYAGYFSVRKGWLKSPSEITQEVIDEFLKKPPRVTRKEKYL